MSVLMERATADMWNSAWETCLQGKDLTNARVAGRATKANPNKEDVAQWHVQGPAWVSDYITWRKNNSNWKIWVTPDDKPAIELDLEATLGGIPIKMQVDRIFNIDGTLAIIDLKTSQQVEQNELQLGFYREGIFQNYGIEIDKGAYYMARTSGTSPLVDLTWYTAEKLNYLVEQFDKSRKAHIFLPNSGGCNLCGFTKQCQFSAKREK